MATSKLEQLAQITVKVLRKQRFVDYQPTLLIDKQIQVIEGIPKGTLHRVAIQRFIAGEGLAGRELLFGVRSGRNEITVGHYRPGAVSFMQIARSRDGYSVEPIENCSWWKLES